MRTTLLLLLLVTLVAWTTASRGDTDPPFRKCLGTCDCPEDESLWNEVLGWTCEERCRYDCMHERVVERKQRQQPIWQYYGKWPFYQFLGMQEPASVLFSILNFWQHWRGYRMLKKMVPEYSLHKTLYLRCAVMAMNAWIWSSVFHARDKPWTEKMDYFSAMAAVLCQLFQTTVRVQGWTKGMNRLLLAVLFMFFCCHVSYLSFWTFDYRYNMAAALTAGALVNLQWLSWWLLRSKEPQKPSRHYRNDIVVAVLMVNAALSLEVLDFVPIGGIFDAHSLWHGATVFVAPFWYRFLVQDAIYESSKERLMTKE